MGKRRADPVDRARSLWPSREAVAEVSAERPAEPDNSANAAIQRRLDYERRSLARSIEADLTTLHHKIDQAMSDLSEGRRIDAHLIANSVMLTEQIARWNLVRDLAPMVTDEDKETTP